MQAAEPNSALTPPGCARHKPGRGPPRCHWKQGDTNFGCWGRWRSCSIPEHKTAPGGSPMCPPAWGGLGTHWVSGSCCWREWGLALGGGLCPLFWGSAVGGGGWGAPRLCPPAPSLGWGRDWRGSPKIPTTLVHPSRSLHPRAHWWGPAPSAPPAPRYPPTRPLSLSHPPWGGLTPSEGTGGRRGSPTPCSWAGMRGAREAREDPQLPHVCGAVPWWGSPCGHEADKELSLKRPRRRSPRKPHLLGSREPLPPAANPIPRLSLLLAELQAGPPSSRSPLPSSSSSSPRVLSHCPIMQAILQATAEMSAAPRPLPSSDWMKVMSQPGVSCRTVAWKRSLKLPKGKKMGSRLGGCRRRRKGMAVGGRLPGILTWDGACRRSRQPPR